MVYFWDNSICCTVYSSKLHGSIPWKIALSWLFYIDVTPGLLSSEDDAGTINERQILINKELPSKCDSEKSNVLAERQPLPTDMASYVLKCKSVFKCRICPRIICLTEDTLRDHLQSKVMHFFLWWLNMLKLLS